MARKFVKSIKCYCFVPDKFFKISKKKRISVKFVLIVDKFVRKNQEHSTDKRNLPVLFACDV